jgi:hypothetical protein
MISLYLLPDSSLLHSARPTLQALPLQIQMPQGICRGHAVHWSVKALHGFRTLAFVLRFLHFHRK